MMAAPAYSSISLSLILYIGLYISSFVVIPVGANVYCFKKLHKSKNSGTPGQSICRGRIDHRSFVTREECCSRRKAVGFYTELETTGRRAKKYKCTPCVQPEIIQDLFTHNGTGWGDWGPYSACSKSCGTGISHRTRICERPDKNCLGDHMESRHCVLQRECPVNGRFSLWLQWSNCTVECGGGTSTRERLCNDPAPSNGGLDCQGEYNQTEQCNTHDCPRDGQWSEWSTSGSCSQTCGRGHIMRTRTCDNPAPVNGGAYCEGSSQRREICKDLPKCPIHGGWTLWSEWTRCDSVCGSSSRKRSRSCLAPMPRHNGNPCVGEKEEESICFNPTPCPVDGGWSDWGVWGPCLAYPCTGAAGTQTRSRTCTDPQPKYHGSLCVGNYTETQNCSNNFGCPVDGGWCGWSDWSNCRPSHIGLFKRKERNCTCPLPENGGRHCSGEDYESKKCGSDLAMESIIPDSGDGTLCNGEGSGGMDDEDC